MVKHCRAYLVGASRAHEGRSQHLDLSLLKAGNELLGRAVRGGVLLGRHGGCEKVMAVRAEMSKMKSEDDKKSCQSKERRTSLGTKAGLL